MTFDELYDDCAVTAWERQQRLGEVVVDRRWDFELATGRLQFSRPGSPPVEVQAQILGTESEYERTWLWSWANEVSDIPGALQRSALDVRALGERCGVSLLVQPKVPLDASVDGHRLAAVATGLLEAEGYFRGPYPGGAVFLLIPSGALPRRASPSLPGVVSTFSQALGRLRLQSHRRALAAYLRGHRFEIRDLGPRALRASGLEGELSATFDAQGRLSRLETTIHPRQ